MISGTIKDLNSYEIIFDIMFLNENFRKGKSVLQIGVKKKPHGVSNWRKMFEYFKLYGYTEFDVLEIWKENLNELEPFPVNKKILGDVRDIKKLISNKYDVIFWWGGPEHVTKKEFLEIQKDIQELKDTLFVISCPYGEYKQGKVDGNPYEEHVSSWYPLDLEQLGFDVYPIKTKDRADLIGIKHIK